MSTRMYINGRPVFVSVGKARAQAPAVDAFAVTKGNEDALPKPPPPPDPTTFWEDVRYGVRFRFVDVLQPADAWVSASTVQYWYSLSYDMLMDCVKRGLVDCVIDKATKARRFRVLDPRALTDDKVARAAKRKK